MEKYFRCSCGTEIIQLSDSIDIFNREKKHLRRQKATIPNDKQLKKLKSPLAFCYSQAKFDVLMDIDMGLKIGAFIRRTK